MHMLKYGDIVYWGDQKGMVVSDGNQEIVEVKLNEDLTIEVKPTELFNSPLVVAFDEELLIKCKDSVVSSIRQLNSDAVNDDVIKFYKNLKISSKLIYSDQKDDKELTLNSLAISLGKISIGVVSGEIMVKCDYEGNVSIEEIYIEQEFKWIPLKQHSVIINENRR